MKGKEKNEISSQFLGIISQLPQNKENVHATNILECGEPQKLMGK